jgi:hypothetical protein
MVHNFHNTILERLPELRSLTFKAGWDDCPCKHEFFVENSLKHHMNVNLDIRRLDTAEVVKYIFLPRLETMSIS